MLIKKYLNIIGHLSLISLFPITVFSQIDYHRNQVDRISAKDSIVRIDWIIHTSKKAPLYFDHSLRFINENEDNDLVGSTVKVELFHNDQLVKTYSARTAEHIENFIILDQPINLNKNDKVYFVFTLIRRHKNESYLFTIDSRIPIAKEIKSNQAKSIITSPVISKSIKEPKYKSYSTKRFLKMKRNQKIGSEINGRFID